MLTLLHDAWKDFYHHQTENSRKTKANKIVITVENYRRQNNIYCYINSAQISYKCSDQSSTEQENKIQNCF